MACLCGPSASVAPLDDDIEHCWHLWECSQGRAGASFHVIQEAAERAGISSTSLVVDTRDGTISSIPRSEAAGASVLVYFISLLYFVLIC